MAVTDRPHPLRGGLDLVPGGVALVLMRALLVLLASLPALAMLMGALAGGPARQPYFTEVSGRLPLFHFTRLMGELSSTLSAGVALTTVLVLLGEQVLVAGALDWLGRGKGKTERSSVWRAVPRTGIGWIWPMLKVVVLAIIWAGIGLALVGKLFDWLDQRSEILDWSAYTQMIALPASRALCSVIWLSLVGAWAFWCRILLVADERRTVRSTWFLVLRVWRRHPLRGPLFYVMVTLVSQGMGAAALAIWRQRPPAEAIGALIWIGSWLLILVLQAYLWYWLLHAGRQLYALPDLDPVHRRPDGPIGIWRALGRLARRLRRKRRAP